MNFYCLLSVYNKDNDLEFLVIKFYQYLGWIYEFVDWKFWVLLGNQIRSIVSVELIKNIEILFEINYCRRIYVNIGLFLMFEVGIFT